MTVRVDGIEQIVPDRRLLELRLRQVSAPCGAASAYRAVVTVRATGPADERPEIQERIVELGVGAFRPRHPVEVEPELPSEGLGPSSHTTNDPFGVRVEQNGPPPESENSDGIGCILAHAREGEEVYVVGGDAPSVPIDQETGNVENPLGSLPQAQ
jgi:hypothetical protein